MKFYVISFVTEFRWLTRNVGDLSKAEFGKRFCEDESFDLKNQIF